MLKSSSTSNWHQDRITEYSDCSSELGPKSRKAIVFWSYGTSSRMTNCLSLHPPITEQCKVTEKVSNGVSLCITFLSNRAHTFVNTALIWLEFSCFAVVVGDHHRAADRCVLCDMSYNVDDDAASCPVETRLYCKQFIPTSNISLEAQTVTKSLVRWLDAFDTWSFQPLYPIYRTGYVCYC